MPPRSAPISALLRRLFAARRGSDTAYHVYGALVAQARQPAFYAEFGVPDTISGRFDMIVLHAFLLFDRLQGTGGEKELAQEVVDVMFSDLDRALREMGVGDLSVPKKVKTMASVFNGRSSAYARAFAANSQDAMRAAIARNVFPDEAAPPAAAGWLARYAFAARESLAAQSHAGIVASGPDFPPARIAVDG